MHRLPRSGTSTVIKHYMLNLFGLLAFGNADSWISFYNIFTLTTINLAIENLLNNRYNLSVDFSPKFFPSFSHSLNFFVQLALIGPINRHVSLFKSNDDDYGNENAQNNQPVSRAKTIALHLRYAFRHISLLSSTKRQREITECKTFWRT